MILSNHFLEVNINDLNGSIISITDKARNVKYLDEEKYARLFRVFIPNEDKWTAQYADNTACTISKIEKISENNIKLFYDNIVTPENIVLDVNVTVDMWLEADELMLSVSLTNNTDLLLHSVRFPWVGGFKVDVDSKTDIARMSIEAPLALSTMKRSPGYNIIKKEMRRDAWLHIPTIDITCANGGIGLNLYCKEVQTLFGFLNCDTQGWEEEFVSFGIEHTPFLAKGESFKSEPCGISLTDGDHTKTWDRMKNFLKTWWKNPNSPKRLKDTIGFANYQLRDFEGRILNEPKDIVKFCDEARAMGMQDITFLDMMYNVYLRAGFGYFMDDGVEGRVDEIKKYVLQEQAKGMFISTWVNYRLASDRSERSAELLKKFRIKGIYGKSPYESFPIRSESARWYTCEYEEYSHPLCQNEPEFKKFALNLADEVMDRTGTNVLYIDQAFGNNFCFNKEHNHRMGMDDHIGSMDWISKVRENMFKRDGCGYMLGEVPDIFNTQYVDLWWHWPWNALSPETIRYILPDTVQSWVIDVHEHEHEINKPFSMGMLLNVNSRGIDGLCSEKPETMARIKRLADLKAKTIERIPINAYIGNRDLKTETDLTVEANLYNVDGKYAVILGDCTKRSKGGNVTLYINVTDLDINNIKVISEHGNEFNAAFKKTDCGYKLELNLKPWEAVVLLLD